MLWLSGLGFMLSEWLGRGERVLSTANLDALLGTPQVFAQLLLLVRIALYITFIHMFFLMLLRFVIRRPLTLAVAFTALQTVMIYSWFVHFFNAAEPTDWLFTFLIACCVTILIMRFGLLATLAANMMLLEPSLFPVVTTRLSSWSATGTVVIFLAIGGLMVFAYITAVGRSHFAETLRNPLRSPD